jgi:hypothetical protein
MPRSRPSFPNVRSGMRFHPKALDLGQARVNFAAVKTAALPLVPALVKRWLPDGRREAGEWVARNPRRDDRTLGSFKINLRTGRWADFATGDKGGDVISLAAYLFGLSQLEAAQRIASMLGVNLEEAHHG